MVGISPKRWFDLVGLPILGLVLLWWASGQLEETLIITGSEFDVPEWRLLGWLLTLIAAGVMFGLAARFAGADSSKSNVAATVVVGTLPLAIVAYFWTRFSFGWSPPVLKSLRWLASEETIVASCVIVGFLAGGLISRFESGSSDDG